MITTTNKKKKGVIVTRCDRCLTIGIALEMGRAEREQAAYIYIPRYLS